MTELTEHHRLTLLVVQNPGQVRDVLHGVCQDCHFGHLLQVRRSRQVLFQGVKATVHSLHPVPLPRVPLDRLDVLLWLDLVPVHWVDRHWTRSHLDKKRFNASVSKSCLDFLPNECFSSTAGGQVVFPIRQLAVN